MRWLPRRPEKGQESCGRASEEAVPRGPGGAPRYFKEALGNPKTAPRWPNKSGPLRRPWRVPRSPSEARIPGNADRGGGHTRIPTGQSNVVPRRRTVSTNPCTLLPTLRPPLWRGGVELIALVRVHLFAYQACLAIRKVAVFFVDIHEADTYQLVVGVSSFRTCTPA